MTNVIILEGTDLGRKVNVIGRRKKIMEAIFTLDHEIGHQVLRNGYPDSYYNISDHLVECAADAYAMLRHIQRFGFDTPVVRDYADGRAMTLLLGPKHTYSSDSVEESIRFARDMGAAFFNLSLRDTAWLAAKIADDCVLSDERLDKTYNAFLPVRGMLNAPFKDHWIMSEKIFSIMRENKTDPDIVKTGKRLLNNKCFKIQALALNPKWQKEFGFVKSKKKQLSAGPQ